MAQVKSVYQNSGTRVVATPSGAVTGRNVKVFGGLVTVSVTDVAANEDGAFETQGFYLMPKVTGAITAGQRVYWDEDADPVGGTAGSGALTTNSALGNFAGFCPKAAASGDETVGCVLRSADAATSVARSALAQDDLAPYPLELDEWHLFDSTIHAPLGATALSADDLIFTLGTLGTTAPTITGTDFGGTTATQKARIRFVVPPEYVAGQTITLRVTSGTLTTVADTSSTIDFNVYRVAAPTVDICATTAQAMNDLAVADHDFTITPTNVVPGDVLDILMTYAGVDSGNLGVIVPTISKTTMLLDIKG